MTLKTTLTALAIALAPPLALAEGCNWGEKRVQSCAPGSTYDAATGTCVTDPVTS